MRISTGLGAAILASIVMAAGLAKAQDHGAASHGVSPPEATPCAPPAMVHIVFREITPGIDPASFVAQPRTLYRLGAGKARIEEVDDPAQRIHQLNVIAEPDIWMANLDSHAGVHAIDPGPTFNAVVPEISGDGVSPRLSRLEFGCEADFIKQNALTPTRVEQVEGGSYDVYRLEADGDAAEILQKQGARTPAFTRYFHAGKLLLVWRYDLYETGLKTDPALFSPVPGVTYQEAKGR